MYAKCAHTNAFHFRFHLVPTVEFPKSFCKSKFPYMSTMLPYPFPSITSGAIYAGVPQSVQVCSVIRLEKPKSTSLMCPSRSIRMFSGFKSR